MLSVNLAGEHNGGKTAQISDYNSLFVTQREAEPPAIGAPSRYRYDTALLGSEGADLGTTNMRVDGSVTPQKFFGVANADFDARIMAIVIIIADGSVAHNSFGGVPALANGWDLIITEAGDSISIINKAKTSGQVIAQSGFGSPYGGDATSFQLTKWTANDDAHTIVIPVGEYIPGGIRVGRGTKDKIEAIVNDDLTGLTEFTVRLIGYRHYP